MLSKKIFASFATLFLLLSTVFSNVSFAKDDIGGALEKEMRAMVAQGIINGYGNDVYNPAGEVTRGEFATFLSRALKLPEIPENSFPDVAPSSSLAIGINSASGIGIVTGYEDGKFYPDKKISRQQAAVMIYRASLYLGMPDVQNELQFIDKDRH